MAEPQRAADRRYFRSIAIYMLVSLGICVYPLVYRAAGGDPWALGHGPRLASLIPVAVMCPVGVIMLGCGVRSLAGRLRMGPMKPGKHSLD